MGVTSSCTVRSGGSSFGQGVKLIDYSSSVSRLRLHGAVLYFTFIKSGLFHALIQMSRNSYLLHFIATDDTVGR